MRSSANKNKKTPGITKDYRAYLSIFGAILINLSLGVLYTFGNALPYLASYLASIHGNTKSKYDQYLNDCSWIYVCQSVGLGTCMFIGGSLERYFDSRLVTLFGGWLMSASVACTYYTISHSFDLTLVTYGLLQGCGLGIAYIPPLVCGMKWFPNHKGFIAGLIICGFGASPTIFDIVMTSFINPHNVKQNTDTGFLFEPQVLNNIPSAFLKLAAIYATMQLVGVLLLFQPPAAAATPAIAVLPTQFEQYAELSMSMRIDRQKVDRNFLGSLASRTQSLLSQQSLSTHDRNQKKQSGAHSMSGALQPQTQKETQEHKPRLSENIHSTHKNDEEDVHNANTNTNMNTKTNTNTNNLLPHSLKNQTSMYDTMSTDKSNANASTILSFETYQNIAIRYETTNMLLNKQKNKDHRTGLRLSDLNVLKDYTFWNLYLTVICSGMCLTYFGTQWKVFINQELGIDNDFVLAWSGGASSICNGFARIFWGFAFDFFKSYKLLMSVMFIIETILLFTWPLLSHIQDYATLEIASFFWLCSLYFFGSGALSIWPTHIASLYGQNNSGINYGLLFTGYIPSSVFGIFAVVSFRSSIGWTWMGNLMGCVQFVALILVCLAGKGNQKYNSDTNANKNRNRQHT